MNFTESFLFIFWIKKKFLFRLQAKKKRHSQCYWKVDNFITTFCRNRTANVHTATHIHTHTPIRQHIHNTNVTNEKICLHWTLNFGLCCGLICTTPYSQFRLQYQLDFDANCRSCIDWLFRGRQNQGTKRINFFFSPVRAYNTVPTINSFL